jgi:hypothetical protein
MPASKAPPSSTDSGFFTPLHPVEYEVLRRLQTQPQLRISSLVIRRIPSGVCLQGVLESDPEHVDLVELLRGIEGVKTVVNQLVPCRPRPKG